MTILFREFVLGEYLNFSGSSRRGEFKNSFRHVGIQIPVGEGPLELHVSLVLVNDQVSLRQKIGIVGDPVLDFHFLTCRLKMKTRLTVHCFLPQILKAVKAIQDIIGQGRIEEISCRDFEVVIDIFLWAVTDWT